MTTVCPKQTAHKQKHQKLPFSWHKRPLSFSFRLLLLGTVTIKHWQSFFHTFKNEAEKCGSENFSLKTQKRIAKWRNQQRQFDGWIRLICGDVHVLTKVWFQNPLKWAWMGSWSTPNSRQDGCLILHRWVHLSWMERVEHLLHLQRGFKHGVK